MSTMPLIKARDLPAPSLTRETGSFLPVFVLALPQSPVLAPCIANLTTLLLKHSGKNVAKVVDVKCLGKKLIPLRTQPKFSETMGC